MVSTVAVLSDVHGVLPALERVLVEPAVANAELIVVTGHHMWGPQPTEVLDRLASLGDRAVLMRGNADRELLLMSQGIDIGLGNDPLSVWGAAQLQAHHQKLLEAMPEQVTIEVDGFGPVWFCHATPRDDEEVVLVDSRPDDHKTGPSGREGHKSLPLVDPMSLVRGVRQRPSRFLWPSRGSGL